MPLSNWVIPIDVIIMKLNVCMCLIILESTKITSMTYSSSSMPTNELMLFSEKLSFLIPDQFELNNRINLLILLKNWLILELQLLNTILILLPSQSIKHRVLFTHWGTGEFYTICQFIEFMCFIDAVLSFQNKSYFNSGVEEGTNSRKIIKYM